MRIRYPSKDESEILADIGAETFWDTYHTDSHLEQSYIKSYINSAFTSENIALELGKESFVYLLAENEQETIGYARILIGNTRKEISGKLSVEISRIYLRKRYWGKKLGLVLLERCFDEARKTNADVIWLSVWKYNERAIKFYKKFGFKIVGEHIFDLAGSSQTDFLMERKVSENDSK